MRDENDIISVVLISYNNLDGLFITIESILRQDYKKIELIISDDGSKAYFDKIDDIRSFVEKKKKDNIINLIYNHNEKNLGTVKNLNKAIALSQGKYYLLLASEDYLSSDDVLSTYVRFQKRNNCLICFGKMVGVTEKGEYVDYLSSCESDYNLLKSYDVKKQRERLYSRNYLPSPAAFFHRALFDRYGLFDEEIRLIEDYPYFLYLSQKNVLFYYLDKVTVYYKLSGVSSSGNYGKIFMKDMFKIYKKYIFPYDKRYGFFQKMYNILKYDGLKYYYYLNDYKKYNLQNKMRFFLKYFPFVLYDNFNKKYYKLKNIISRK